MSEVWLEGRFLAPDGWRDGPLGLSGGRIGDPGSGARRVDARGKLILPGIVDIHGDGFEWHLAPRRGAMTDLQTGLFAAEAELAANGITTAVLAQFWSWEGGMRSPDFATRMLDAWDIVAPQVATDLRVQLRIETHHLEAHDAALAAIARHGIDYVAFNDHLPHARLAAGRSIPRLTGTALKSGRSPEAHLALMQRLHALAPEVPAAMDALCATLRGAGVTLASHDDATPEDRAAWRARGCAISEFPETQEAAAAAHAARDGVVMGAPNVARGASHKGKVSAREMLAAGHVDALASDYHYPAPRQAILGLGAPLETLWPLISSGPARLLGLADRGTLEAGRRADLVVLDAETRRLEMTIANGAISFARGEMAARLL
jgi:alpha-D-ribose 1-methylphosphonate 5-triphosphate diphosphatase